ncbi:hypothetical protein [Pelosinus sp. sgz500959]|uniref:hypothetical protein n=1 Tax=Pelosinus sp. sgz500959 TaxID=3242472 RepID=UPI00367034F4
MVNLKLWKWFCKLDDKKNSYRIKTGQPTFVPKQVSERVAQSGVDMTCSRICGHDGCRCGSTVRGLHCVWSYYRLE